MKFKQVFVETYEAYYKLQYTNTIIKVIGHCKKLYNFIKLKLLPIMTYCY